VTAYPPVSRLALQGLQRGETADPGSLMPGIPSRRHRGTAQAKVWLSHRPCAPAQEADALEPQGHRIRHRQPSLRTGRHCRETRWRAPSYGCEQWELGTTSPPVALSEAVPAERRCQPDATGEADPRRRQRLEECPGEADVGAVCGKGQWCVRGNEPQRRIARA
jgi:hypothetical protein